MYCKIRAEKGIIFFKFPEPVSGEEKKAITLHLEGGNFILAADKKSGSLCPDHIELHFVEKFDPRTLTQNNTLRMVEKWIFYAQNEYWPKNEEIYWLHEELLDTYSVRKFTPNGKESVVRTSDPRMNVKIMARLINGALHVLSEQDIPKSVLDDIGEDIRVLYRRMREWIYKQNSEFIMEAEQEFAINKNLCEISGDPGNEMDPVERMHLVANLQSNEALYNHPRVFVWARRSIHRKQHDEGWDALEKYYPALKRRRKLAIEFVSHIRGN